MSIRSIDLAHEDVFDIAGSPVPSPILEYLRTLHAELADVTDGEVATYIPELGRADPSWFGISIATIDGHVYEVGDTRVPFTIQSISKPFVFGLALEDHGLAGVSERVGVEPSGNPFNSIAVDAATNRPFNPMVNAGAIVAASLVRESSPEGRLQRVLDAFGRYVGHEVEIDPTVLESERETGDRNRAIAYLMRTLDKLEGDVDEVLDLYFAQCAVVVDSRDLAVMGATLANGGEHPVSNVQAMQRECVPRVLSVMSSCGMYDYAGEWIYTVGLPAKSGVSGGMLAVLPGQFGIGVFSPPLDPRGNSVRGIRACQRLSSDLLLHPLRSTSSHGSAVRHHLNGPAARSRRVRCREEEDVLARCDKAVSVYELQGNLFFASIESVVRRILDDVEPVEFVVLDCKRVHHVDETAVATLARLASGLEASGRRLLISHLDRLDLCFAQFADTDQALQWCEAQLLARVATARGTDARALQSQELLEGLTADEIQSIADVVDIKTFAAAEVVFHANDSADCLYFVLSGSLSALLALDVGERTRRVATFGAGCAFGEMALLDEGRRSASVVADEPSTVASLSLAVLRDLETDAARSGVTAVIHRNLARNLSRRLRNANAQIQALDR